MNKAWDLYFGDCIPHMGTTMEPQSVDLSVFSPPFPSVYAYTSEAADLGNTDDVEHEGKLHLGFFFSALLRVMKPGRVVVVHCQDIPRMKRSGGQGLFDFRGLLLRIAERAGFVYEYSWAIRKNPQSQAIRTRAHDLQFQGLESDRAGSRGALPDHLLKFRAPGENRVSIEGKGEVSRKEWIAWAEYCWGDIRETDTLNGQAGLRAAKGEEDRRHICPLQLGVIDRIVRLFSDPEELVFSPFAGIGSEGHIALKRGRRFYGCELKREYFEQAKKNLTAAEVAHKESQWTLFNMAETAP